MLAEGGPDHLKIITYERRGYSNRMRARQLLWRKSNNFRSRKRRAAQVSLNPRGGGLGAARPWGRSRGNAGPPQVSLNPRGAGWAQPGPGALRGRGSSRRLPGPKAPTDPRSAGASRKPRPAARSAVCRGRGRRGSGSPHGVRRPAGNSRTGGAGLSGLWRKLRPWPCRRWTAISRGQARSTSSGGAPRCARGCPGRRKGRRAAPAPWRRFESGLPEVRVEDDEFAPRQRDRVGHGLAVGRVGVEPRFQGRRVHAFGSPGSAKPQRYHS